MNIHVLLVLALNGFAVAQDPFMIPRREALPPDPYSANRVRAADVDGDQRIDLVFANGVTSFGEPSSVWRQFELLRFEDAGGRMDPETGQTSDVAIGDVDGDGDRDLVLAQLDEDSRLYLNDGNGQFSDVTARQMPAVRGGARAVLLFDADGDGDLDLFFGNDNLSSGQLDELYLNDGSGRFSPVSSTYLPPRTDQTLSAVVCDIENDGDLDLVLGTRSGPRLYANVGTRFDDGTALRLPASTERVFDIATGDVDNDGDVDLLLATNFQDRLLINDGLGVFQRSQDGLPSVSDNSRAALLGDLDGDGDLDAVIGNGEDGAGSANRLLLNRGDGRFDDAPDRLPVDAGATRGLALVDVDDDGDLDVACANSWFHGNAPNTVLLNDGSAHFVDLSGTALPRVADRVHDFGVGDLDGDGDLDVVSAALREEGRGSGAFDGLRVQLADGYGGYATVATPPVSGATRVVAVFDAEQDGDLDIAGAPHGAAPWLLLNDGSAGWSSAPVGAMPSYTPSANTMIAADLEGDGDQDLVIGTSGGSPQLLLINDGSGRFVDDTAARTPRFFNNSSDGLVAADFDRDGDVDLVGVGGGWGTWALRNDGTGHFTDVSTVWLPGAPHGRRVVAAGDLDGDGDFDLVFDSDRVWRNRGDGVCLPGAPGSFPAPRFQAAGVTLVDVDGDGDLDAVGVGDGRTAGTASRYLLLNDGTGTFVRDARTWDAEGFELWSTVESADLDGDGDGDLLLGGPGSRFAYGRRRHIEVPELAFVGLDLVVRLHADGAPAGTRGVVLWSPAPAQVSLGGIGVLRLDPSLLGLLADWTIDPSSSSMTLRRHIPNDPNLVGASIHVQGLLVGGSVGGGAVLTNAVREELR